MIGSTANIVALGMLEKHGGSQISFFQWFKVGLVCTILSGAIAIGALLILAPHMPDHKITFQKLSAASGYVPASEVFPGKLSGQLSYDSGSYYLTGSGGAKIRVVFPENVTATVGKVSVSGNFNKDTENKKYPYLLVAEKLEVLKEKE